MWHIGSALAWSGRLRSLPALARDLGASVVVLAAFVAAAGQIPPGGVGTSLVLDPAGQTLVELGEERGVAVADLDPARIREVRAANPALRLRRYTVLPR